VNEEEAWERRAVENNFRIVRSVESTAKSRGATCSQVALAWLIYKGVIPIVGARNLEQLETNLGCIGVQLQNTELENLDQISSFELGYPYRFIHEVFPSR
jgi:aryl-alcohol dehydrogenase-like predicted oxidoreductase